MVFKIETKEQMQKLITQLFLWLKTKKKKKHSKWNSETFS